MQNQNRRRFFAIRAKKAKTENTIRIGGVDVLITARNAAFAETVRRNRAESAYEQAAFRAAA